MRKQRFRTIRLLLLTVIGGYFAVSMLTLAGSFYYTLQAKSSAEAIVDRVREGQFNRAFAELSELQESIDSAETLSKPSVWLRYVPVIRSDYIVYSELLSAGSQLTASVSDVVRSLSEQNISRSLTLDTLDIKTAPQALLGTQDELLASFDHLEEAANQAENLHIGYLPSGIRSDLASVQSQLITFKERVLPFRPYLENLDTLLGSGDPHEILVLLQNPHEIRPTGGFVGSFARVTLNNGRIEELYADDVYNIDVHLIGNETELAPDPIYQFLNVRDLYLRDANWSPDFPTSAQKIKELYKIETGETVDTVAAITPYLVEQFIGITGPVTVNDITFTEENFMEELQYRVEQEYWRIGLEEEERKQIIDDLAAVLKNRLFTLSSEDLRKVFDSAFEALNRREIQAYTAYADIQNFLEEQNWAGRVQTPKTDYLYVVDANIGALKTDRVVERVRDYDLTQQADGTWQAKLRLTYINNGHFDYRTSRYRSYIRVYTPIGSELVRSTGFVEEDKSLDFVEPNVYSEFDKQVYAGFVSVEPGDTRYVEVTYTLPPWLNAKINHSNRYELFVQKQGGLDPYQVDVSIDARNRLHSLAPSDIDYQLSDASTLNFTDTLEKDTNYTVSFKD